MSRMQRFYCLLFLHFDFVMSLTYIDRAEALFDMAGVKFFWFPKVSTFDKKTMMRNVDVL